VCQKREPVSDNTVVFHIQLLLPDGQNLGQTLCSQGFATRDVPLPPPLSVHCDTADVSDSSVAAANVSFGILAPVNPVPPESLVRLSSKRFVRYCVTFAFIAGEISGWRGMDRMNILYVSLFVRLLVLHRENGLSYWPTPFPGWMLGD